MKTKHELYLSRSKWKARLLALGALLVSLGFIKQGFWVTISVFFGIIVLGISNDVGLLLAVDHQDEKEYVPDEGSGQQL